MTSRKNPEAVIADSIRDSAKERGITLESIHERIGMSQRTFTRYMAGIPGKQSFNMIELIRIAQALDTTVSELLPDEILEAKVSA